ncbi:peptidylprolyl isomerase [Algibacter lectus]|nr:peptidylprolyl isomerase [Algibacter lectus]
MDENANKGGDLGWFLSGEVHPDFESAIVSSNIT